MKTQDIHSLIKHLEAASSLDAALAAAVQNAVCALGAGSLTLPADGGLFSTDEVIHLIDEALPEWSIKLTGRASNINGHWVCTLRQSEVRDNDEVIGIGQSAILAHALLAALLKVIDGRPREV